MKQQKLKSIWTPIQSKRAGVTGYLEKFITRQGVAVSIPGVSRWIDGPVFDENKAYIA